MFFCAGLASLDSGANHAPALNHLAVWRHCRPTKIRTGAALNHLVLRRHCRPTKIRAGAALNHLVVRRTAAPPGFVPEPLSTTW